ncbi:hypothetical protein V8C86DRAFT_996715 [Haematococcus lacustris]
MAARMRAALHGAQGGAPPLLPGPFRPPGQEPTAELGLEFWPLVNPRAHALGASSTTSTTSTTTHPALRSNRLLNLQAARSWEALLQQVARQPQGARPEQLLQAAVMMVLQERHQAAAGLLQRLDATHPPSSPTEAISSSDPVAGAARGTFRAGSSRGAEGAGILGREGGRVRRGGGGVGWGELALQRDYLRLWLLLAGVDPDAPAPSGVAVAPSRSVPQSRLLSKVREGVAVAAGWARRCGAAEPRWRARWAAMTHTLEVCGMAWQLRSGSSVARLGFFPSNQIYGQRRK